MEEEVNVKTTLAWFWSANAFHKNAMRLPEQWIAGQHDSKKLNIVVFANDLMGFRENVYLQNG